MTLAINHILVVKPMMLITKKLVHFLCLLVINVFSNKCDLVAALLNVEIRQGIMNYSVYSITIIFKTLFI